MAGKPVVVLSSLKVANELLSKHDITTTRTNHYIVLKDKRSAIYSSRPPATVVGDILAGGRSIVSLIYGPLDIQEGQARDLLHRLLNDPERWTFHVERSISLDIVQLVYGTTLPEKNHEYMWGRCLHLLHTYFHLEHVGAIVEIFPFLQYLPSALAQWKRKAQDMCREYDGLFGMWLNEAISSVTPPLQSPSLLMAFVLAMIRHPEVMRKAQDELDEVLGRERLPTSDDSDSLVYINAVVKELLRWWPVAPLGLCLIIV
ncbi:hypothetical protein EIP86_005910 [Pleurotus ostreatoroseus]|nr:hypothetical protein EIP86_005910 [Pleurotus ostreatoroseus]